VRKGELRAGKGEKGAHFRECVLEKKQKIKKSSPRASTSYDKIQKIKVDKLFQGCYNQKS